jgi:hypothetical protein
MKNDKTRPMTQKQRTLLTKNGVELPLETTIHAAAKKLNKIFAAVKLKVK